jgi:hypothetical protein
VALLPASAPLSVAANVRPAIAATLPVHPQPAAAMLPVLAAAPAAARPLQATAYPPPAAGAARHGCCGLRAAAQSGAELPKRRLRLSVRIAQEEEEADASARVPAPGSFLTARSHAPCSGGLRDQAPEHIRAQHYKPAQRQLHAGNEGREAARRATLQERLEPEADAHVDSLDEPDPGLDTPYPQLGIKAVRLGSFPQQGGDPATPSKDEDPPVRRRWQGLPAQHKPLPDATMSPLATEQSSRPKSILEAVHAPQARPKRPNLRCASLHAVTKVCVMRAASLANLCVSDASRPCK